MHDFSKVIDKSENWPIVKLNLNKNKFFENIKNSVINKIFLKYKNCEDIVKLLIRNLDSEKNQKNNQKHLIFWNSLEGELNKLSSEYANIEENKELIISFLKKIIEFYLEEIHGNFSLSHYNFTKKTVEFFLSKLLNPISIPYSDGFINESIKLKEKIKIIADIEKIRSLFKKGILILLPSHFSNLDSAIIAWVTDYLGLPPFLYAAGLNLFSNKFWNYFLSKIGTYKIDRNKKNIFYLQTIDSYLLETIKFECNNLFYPHGGRSRSGAIEDNIKKGLLYSVLSAQEDLVKENGIYTKKIFLIPLTINYSFVLEDNLFAKSCSENFFNKENLYAEKHEKEPFDLYNKFFDIASFTRKIVLEESNISVIFGNPIDVFANKVNDLGKSFKNQELVSVHEMIKKNENNFYKSEDHIKILSNQIISEQKRCTEILGSNIIAYIFFFVLKKHIENMDKNSVYSFLKNFEIESKILFKLFVKLNPAFIYIKEKNLGFINQELMNCNDEKNIEKYIKELGVYHINKPLCFGKSGFLCKDFGLLIYYQNKLSHYSHIFDTYLSN